ncbi:hypothetical protein [uncultured Ferrimonas sp.]|uniref:hypothetical protein n=1 Tax=uncultured Ferrimonas sp. TaxID=432640 RepID=UPI0026365A1A|nr:hypothetical protein [uncultured Ferrimonas sp.]
MKTETPLECWFARNLIPGALDGVDESTSAITGPYSTPRIWVQPSDPVSFEEGAPPLRQRAVAVTALSFPFLFLPFSFPFFLFPFLLSLLLLCRGQQFLAADF